MIDISLFDLAFSFVTAIGAVAEYKLMGTIREQIGNNSWYAYAYCFKTKNGWVMVNLIGDGIWRRFCRVIGREELIEDPRFDSDMSRYLNKETITDMLTPWFESRTVDEILAILHKARVACAKANNVAEAIAEPQVAIREMLLEQEHAGVGNVPVPGIAVKLSESPGSVRSSAARLGQHNEEVYCGLLGLTHNELLKMQDEKVI